MDDSFHVTKVNKSHFSLLRAETLTSSHLMASCYRIGTKTTCSSQKSPSSPVDHLCRRHGNERAG